jgi:hypothetical protein
MGTKTVLSNRKLGEAVVLVTETAAAGSTTIVVAGGSSDIDNDTGTDETVTGANINKIKFGCGGSATGFWKITRGGGTVAVLSNSGEIDFDGSGMALTANNTSDIVCVLTGSTDGFLLFELQKTSSVPTDPYNVP